MKVFSILTDFVFLAKVHQTVLEIHVNFMSILGDEVLIFDKEIKNFERILICVNSRKFSVFVQKTLSPMKM